MSLLPEQPIESSLNPGLPPSGELRRVVSAALAEDVGWGDITTRSLIDPSVRAHASIVVKEPGLLAGMPVLVETFNQVDPTVAIEIRHQDGEVLSAGQVVAQLHGPASGILTGERVALNFLQRLSGIATLTAAFVAEVRGFHARIVDTRKTTPGLRALEKYAVRVGGGSNHRFNLSDGVLIKENHLAALIAGGISESRVVEEAIRLARLKAPHTAKVEVEVERIDQVMQAVSAGADIILLDNMSLDQLREAVAMVAGRCILEASGGVNLNTVQAIASTGVDLISVGALTHSAKALDISLDMEIVS